MALAFTVAAAVAVVIVAWLAADYASSYRWLRRLSHPGAPLPLIGHAAIFFGLEPAEILIKLDSVLRANGEKRLMGAVLGLRRMAFLFHPETVQPILSSPVHLEKSQEYDSLLPWLNRGLLLSYGDKWRRRRKLLTPSFHFRILDDSLSVFNRCADALAGNLLDDAGGEAGGEGILDVFPYVIRCTLDVMLEASMGKRMNIQENRDSEYARAIGDMVHLVQTRQRLPWLWPDKLFALSRWKAAQDRCLEVLHGFTKSVIGERRRELASGTDDDGFPQKKRLAFLDLLLRTKEGGLTDADLQEEVDTFMFEGHDTTACSITWTLLLLANHPEVQERCHREQLEVFESADEDVGMEHLARMIYLEAVIKESLRLYPSVALIGRRLREPAVIDGVEMSAGTSAVVVVMALHRNPDVWPRPDDFVPERFLPGSKHEYDARKYPYAYVPFSAGPRNCIGMKFAQMEEKTVLSKLIRRVKFGKVTSVGDDDARPVIEIITRPSGPVKVTISPR